MAARGRRAACFARVDPSVQHCSASLSAPCGRSRGSAAQVCPSPMLAYAVCPVGVECSGARFMPLSILHCAGRCYCFAEGSHSIPCNPQRNVQGHRLNQ
eukprot:10266355-Ditylum_brightwellii.AAC.1